MFTSPRYAGQPAADAFKRRMEQLDMRVYLHYPIQGYPNNIPLHVHVPQVGGSGLVGQIDRML